MGSPASLTRRGSQTRSLILGAAEALFAERGFDATRLEDVAERVGLCLRAIPAERLSLVPDCGFFAVPRWVAAEKLQRLAAGARLARQKLGGRA